MMRYRELFLQKQHHLVSMYVHDSEGTSGLSQAMQYMIDAPGKLIRAMLLYVVGEGLGIDVMYLHHPAIALEWLHLFSLVHDDLPAMDDDMWRRGQRSCHAAFDEATAILVGDALQAMVYQCVTDPSYPALDMTKCRMVQCIARSSGPRGLMLGQYRDLQADSRLTWAQLESLFMQKTAGLFQLAVQLPLCFVPEVDGALRQALNTLAFHLGMAFQKQDDLDDRLLGPCHTLPWAHCLRFFSEDEVAGQIKDHLDQVALLMQSVNLYNRQPLLDFWAHYQAVFVKASNM